MLTGVVTERMREEPEICVFDRNRTVPRGLVPAHGPVTLSYAPPPHPCLRRASTPPFGYNTQLSTFPEGDTTPHSCTPPPFAPVTLAALAEVPAWREWREGGNELELLSAAMQPARVSARRLTNAPLHELKV
eukprot:768819-Hanusia_phi.AAC.5